MFKGGVIEDPAVSNGKISAYCYPTETDEDGDNHRHIYTAISVVLDHNKTLVKIYDLDFSGFENNFEGQILNYKNDCNLEFTSLSTLCGYSNKTVVDLEIQEDSLWCLAYEDLSSNKMSNLINTDRGENTAMAFRSFIDRYTIKRGEYSEDKTEKCLKNSVWSLDDQLLLERVEDKEHIHSAIMINETIKSRYLRRYGGNYVEKIPVDYHKDCTEFQKRLKEIQDGNLDNFEILRREHYEEEHKILKPISLSIIDLGQYDKVPVIVREDTISVLKKNSSFNSYSKYINKNLIDIQLSYERNPAKCKLTAVRKLFKQKTPRELALSYISVFKSIYSEFIIRVEKRLEEGSGFPHSIYEIPSQSIKFDLLKLLRTQLAKEGAKIFQECLKMI